MPPILPQTLAKFCSLATKVSSLPIVSLCFSLLFFANLLFGTKNFLISLRPSPSLVPLVWVLGWPSYLPMPIHTNVPSALADNKNVTMPAPALSAVVTGLLCAPMLVSL